MYYRKGKGSIKNATQNLNLKYHSLKPSLDLCEALMKNSIYSLVKKLTTNINSIIQIKVFEKCYFHNLVSQNSETLIHSLILPGVHL